MFPRGPLVCSSAASKAIAGLSDGAIRRETDAELLNRIANHPDVRPTFGYHDGETDLSQLFDHPDSYVVLTDGNSAASIWEWSAPGVWQAHFLMLPESRGEYGVAAGKAMCRFMHEQIGARLLWGMTPDSKEFRRAQMFNRLLGAKPAGQITDAANVRCHLFVMEAR